MEYILKAAKLDNKKKLLLAESFILLAICRILILTVKFKRISPYLGTHMKESSEKIDDIDVFKIRSVAWAVNTASRFTFWESKCLVQAMAVKYMLKRRKLKSTVYLGVLRDEKNEMKAHAWIRCGSIIVTGARGREKFKVVSIFGDI